MRFVRPLRGVAESTLGAVTKHHCLLGIRSFARCRVPMDSRECTLSLPVPSWFLVGCLAVQAVEGSREVLVLVLVL